MPKKYQFDVSYYQIKTYHYCGIVKIFLHHDILNGDLTVNSGECVKLSDHLFSKIKILSINNITHNDIILKINNNAKIILKNNHIATLKKMIVIGF